MSQLDAMTREVLDWIQPMLPDNRRDSMNTSIKLSEEASELTQAIYSRGKNVGEELADILILLVDIAYMHGIDLQEEFNEKMNVNRKRTWNIEKGALKHDHAD